MWNISTALAYVDVKFSPGLPWKKAAFSKKKALLA
jgi:hypothetical protein